MAPDLSSLNDSSSWITNEKASQILGVDIKNLKAQRTIYLDKVIEKIERAPLHLKDSAFEKLSLSLRTRHYPNNRMREFTRWSLFLPVLELVNDTLMEEFHLEDYMDMEIKNAVVPNQSNYSVDEPSYDEAWREEVIKPGVKCQVVAGKRTMLTIECKRYKAVHGFKQALLHLKDVRDKEKARGTPRGVRNHLYLIKFSINNFNCPLTAGSLRGGHQP